MKKSQILSLAVIVPLLGVFGAATVSWGSNPTAGCWDEYNMRGTRMYRTVAPAGVAIDDCRPAENCFTGFSAKSGEPSRRYVPHRADPLTACESVPETTTSVAPTTTAPPTTTTLPPAGDGPDRFELLPVGSELPTDEQCASWVRPMTENRPENAVYNATAGVGNDSLYPRVTGAFTGTTDEIIQWTACKWGIDEDQVRAQINIESSWKQTALGDFTTNADACAPGHPIGTYPPQWSGDAQHTGECPESVGLGQVRWLYHQSAFAEDNAVNSSAYNLDYTYAVWRTCFEGDFGWLNDVEGRGDYVAGDAEGCFGVWFSGRWYTEKAIGYIGRVADTLAARPWEQSWFPAAQPAGDGGASTTVPATTVPDTTVPDTTVPATTVPATTVPDTTVPATTVPSTTTPPTTVPPPPSDAAFIETFDGNSGLDRFRTGVVHRDDIMVGQTTWQSDHDLDCGSPFTTRTIHRDRPEESIYMCRDHLMTSVGDTSGYSIAWFSPDQTFNGQTTVSWDVNVTDLGTRQWWEVMIAPVDHADTACSEIATACDSPMFGFYENDAVAVGNGPFGSGKPKITTGGSTAAMTGIGRLMCELDAEGCASKPIRRTWSITDNQNGTVTVRFMEYTWTHAGSFPNEPWKVVFKDHSYTPNKDEIPVGYTWHWDNIIVS